MDTRRIGSLDVSAVGLGCNNFGWHIDEAASRKVIDAALDAGITHFDTAESYGDGASEEFLGRALGDRRNDITIATKFGHRSSDGPAGQATPEAVRASCEASLRRLGTDHIDLYYLHRPDPETPIADTLGALSELVGEGKVREIACSGFSAQQLREAESVATEARFTALQNEFSLLHREPTKNGALDACRELDVAFVPYFPLKSGLLTGKYRKGNLPEGTRLSGEEGSYFKDLGDRLLTEEVLETVEQLARFAESRNRTLLELAFSGLLAHAPVASVIAGATKPAQVHANVKAAGRHLTRDDLDAIEALLDKQPA